MLDVGDFISTPSGVSLISIVWHIDAEDGTDGVEIEFSVEDGENSTDDEGGTETEAGDPRTQASIASGAPSRIQGQLHFDTSKQFANLVNSSNSDHAAIRTCRSSPHICQPQGGRLRCHSAAR